MEAHRRYDRPLVLTETSHPGVDRPLWLLRIAEECSRAIEANIPLWGICLYPIIDRPNWDNLNDWHRAGLWDIEPNSMSRILHEPSGVAMQSAQYRTQQAIRMASGHSLYRTQNTKFSVFPTSKPWVFVRDMIG